MLIIKERFASKELRMFRYLSPRMNLSDKDRQYHFRLEKGFEGEKNFDAWIKKDLICNCLILNDLLFDIDNSVSQMDSLFLLLPLHSFFSFLGHDSLTFVTVTTKINSNRERSYIFTKNQKASHAESREAF